MSRINTQNELLNAISEVRDALSNRMLMDAILKEGSVSDFERQLMSSVAAIISAFDVSMSFDQMDDALGRGDGSIGDLSRTIAEAYGVATSRLMLHGSSLANVSIGLALRGRFGRPPHILVDRSCHASVAGGLALCGAKVAWLARRYHTALAVQPPLTGHEILAALEENPDIDAVWLTLPTYDGILPADVAAIRRACDDHSAMLIIDSAWGANLGLLENAGFPASPARHAHATVISLHKHGLGLSGASVALFNDEELASEFDRVCDIGLASTSPPFYAIAVLEIAFENWRGPYGKRAAEDVIDAAKRFQDAMAALPGVIPVRAADFGPDFVSDPSHQLFSVREAGVTGYHLLQRLSKGYRIDAEKATLTSILFLFGPEHVDCWEEIVEAVKEIISGSPGSANPDLPALPRSLPPIAMTMQEALGRPKRTVRTADAIGKVSGQMIAAYPPGSAMFQPGEIFTEILIDYLRALEAAGSRIKGIDGRLDEAGLSIIDDQNTEES